jgi:D-proline reductase (dithiol) PrdB
VRPPRALWVSFPLGRPLGIPGDADFQLDVLRATLGMLSTATKPTIEDYPTDAPSAGPETWACPLTLEVEPDDSLGGQLLAEVGRLRPWAAETRRRRGRTLFGLSGAEPDQVDDVATVLATIAESGNVTDQPDTDIEWAHPMPFLLRHLADDLRSFYHEAIAAQPGDTPPNHEALNGWIFGETVLGEVLLAIADHLTAVGAANPMAGIVRNLTVPEGH